MIYQINGMEFPSVTTIQGIEDKGEGLLNWKIGILLSSLRENLDKGLCWEEMIPAAWEALNQTSEETTSTGNTVHKAIEIYTTTQKLPNKKSMSASEINAFKAFLKWEKDYQPEFIHNEKVIYSERVGVAGTIDSIVRIGNSVFALDYKTSGSIRAEYKTQTIVYKKIWNEMVSEGLVEGPLVYKNGVLRLDKNTGEYEWKDYTLKKGYEKEEERLWEAYQTLVKYYYLSKNRRLKNNPFIERMNIKLIS